MSEYNNVIEIIAPCNIQQVRKNYTPYLSKAILQKQKNLQKLYNKAKQTKCNEDWLKYKNTKTSVNKEISQLRKKYITDKLDSSNDRWKTVKDLNNNNAKQNTKKYN